MRKETNFSYRYVYAGYELLLLLLLAGSGCPRLAQMAMVDASHAETLAVVALHGSHVKWAMILFGRMAVNDFHNAGTTTLLYHHAQ